MQKFQLTDFCVDSEHNNAFTYPGDVFKSYCILYDPILLRAALVVVNQLFIRDFILLGYLIDCTSDYNHIA